MKSKQWPNSGELVMSLMSLERQSHMMVQCSTRVHIALRCALNLCQLWWMRQCQRWGKVEKQKIHTWEYLSSFPSAQHMLHLVIPLIYKVWNDITSQKYVNTTSISLFEMSLLDLGRKNHLNPAVCLESYSWKMCAGFKWIKAITCTFL